MPKNKAVVVVDLMEQYRAAVAAAPQSAEAHCNLGWGHYGRGQWPEAIAAFKQALQLDQQWLDAHYGLGLALKASGSKTEAVAALEQTQADIATLEDKVRGSMLARLVQGQINEIKTGDWNLPKG